MRFISALIFGVKTSATATRKHIKHVMLKYINFLLLLAILSLCHMQAVSAHRLPRSIHNNWLPATEPVTLPKITKEDWKALLQAWKDVDKAVNEPKAQPPPPMTTSAPPPSLPATQTLSLPALIPIQLSGMQQILKSMPKPAPAIPPPPPTPPPQAPPKVETETVIEVKPPANPYLALLKLWTPAVPAVKTNHWAW